MPFLLVVAMSACGVLVLMAGAANFMGRRTKTPVRQVSRPELPRPRAEAMTKIQQETELASRIKALTAKEEALAKSIRELEDGADSRKFSRLAAEQTAVNTAIAAKNQAESRIQELLDRERKLTNVVSGLKADTDHLTAQLDLLSADVADRVRTKTALDESVGALFVRQRDMEIRLQDLERDIEDRRKEKLAEMEASINAQKEIALVKVMAWSEAEKSRLQERFESAYQAEIADLRRQLIEKVTAEFDSIHSYFSAFAAERKLMAEAEIRDFLAKKRSTILSNLK